MVKNNSTYLFIIGALLIMFNSTNLLGQTEPKKDTIYTNDDSFENKAKFSAKDSLYNDLKAKKLHLFGDAKLDFEDMQMTADYIMVDFEKQEIFASYTLDKDSNRVGMPKMNMNGEEVEAAKIRVNYKTKKAFIHEVKIKQEEIYLYMGVAKRQENAQIHFKEGRFTTCDLPEPHYHFQLSKAILVPEKRIATGPMNLWIKGVPTPLGLPFAFIPQKKPNENKHGILIPKMVPQSVFGMGVSELGYYIPINDSLQTTMFLDLYTKGSWGISNRTQYNVRYKYVGDFRIGYLQNRQPFPSTDRTNKITFIWNHKQDQKASPFWNFNSRVNFISDNNAKNTLNPVNTNYFNNSFSSDINLLRLFPGKPITMGLKASVRQNSQSRNFVISLPTFSLNTTRFYPLKGLNKNKIGPVKWYEQIGMTYNLEAQNSATFQDSLLKNKAYDQIMRKFQNGVTQTATLQTTIPLFSNTWKLTPSLNYGNVVNFQQIRKSQVNDSIIFDTLNKAAMSQNLSLNMQLTTVVYTYYKFVGKKKPLLRHIMTPSFGYQYIPILNKNFTYLNSTNESVRYSIFEKSLYRGANVNDQSIFNFALNNTFELKRKSEKDTITGFKKTRIIDALTFSGNYDFLRDSMKLSNINIDLRVSPFDFLNVVVNGIFSPYDWNPITGKTIGQFAIQNRDILGRFVNFNFNTSLTIAPKASRKVMQDNKDVFLNNWNADYQYYALHPELFVDFAIPWKFNFNYLYSIAANQNKNNLTSEGARNYLPTHTISMNGDISFTKRWKVVTNIYFDLKQMKISNASLNFTRDMHCWRLAFNWIPIGTNKSFLLTIASTSNLFKDAKLDFRKPPEIF